MRIGDKITNPGELRTKVTLLPPILARQPGGAQKVTWDDAHGVTAWVRWTNVHGSEVWASQAIEAVKPATVFMRYYEGLNETWAVKLDNQIYQIVSLDDISNRHEYVELKVKLITGSS